MDIVYTFTKFWSKLSKLSNKFLKSGAATEWFHSDVELSIGIVLLEDWWEFTLLHTFYR